MASFLLSLHPVQHVGQHFPKQCLIIKGQIKNVECVHYVLKQVQNVKMHYIREKGGCLNNLFENQCNSYLNYIYFVLNITQ